MPQSPERVKKTYKKYLNYKTPEFKTPKIQDTLISKGLNVKTHKASEHKLFSKHSDTIHLNLIYE